MNKIALTSIQIPHTTNIFDGIKTVEWRKIALPIGEHYVYETQTQGGCGAVIGSMQIARHYKFASVGEIPDWLIRAGCVSREFLWEYAGKKTIYANMLFGARRFRRHFHISVFDPYCKFKKNSECHKAEDCPHISNNFYPWNAKPSCMKLITLPPQTFMYIEKPESEKWLYEDT